MATYYIDIDNTITNTQYNPATDEAVVGASVYSSAQPVPERIEQINKLYDEGHNIAYWTGRGTVSGVDFTELTKQQLEQWGAKYHFLYMGKPNFDFLVDDKAMNSEHFFAQKRVGLVINNLIRDYISRLKMFYEHYVKAKPIEPINPYQLELSFPLDKEEFQNIYQWLYYGVPLEVFGGANQTQTNLLARLGTFQTKINDRLILLSRETTRSKYATLSFLAKNQCDLNEILFVENYADYWNYVDILITDNPEIIRAKPANKTVVVLKNDYNTEFHDEKYTITSAEEIFTLPIFNRKPVKQEELIHVTGEMMDEEDTVMDNPEELKVEGAELVKLNEANVVFDTDGRPVLDLTAATEVDNNS